MSDSRISVLIPSHNHAAYVGETLRSIAAQTQRPQELLVIDDGSTDGSAAIIERMLPSLGLNARLVARKNCGLSRTLNEGLAATTGDYFAYVGSDDYWHPNHLEWLSSALERLPEAPLAYGHGVLVNANGDVLDVTRGRPYRTGGHFWSLFSGHFSPASCSVLYRREALMRERWNPEAKVEDFDLYLRLALLGPFVFVDRPVGYWRAHGKNTSDDRALMREQTEAAVRRIAERLGLPKGILHGVLAARRFRDAGLQIDEGRRFRALLESLRFLPHARSLQDVLRRAVRLGSPPALLRWRAGQVASRARSLNSEHAGAGEPEQGNTL